MHSTGICTASGPLGRFGVQALEEGVWMVNSTVQQEEELSFVSDNPWVSMQACHYSSESESGYISSSHIRLIRCLAVIGQASFTREHLV